MNDADMRKIRTIPFFLGIALAIALVNVSTEGQIRRNSRLAPGQRGINRPPFGIGLPGGNRRLNPNQIRRQQLQQRLMQAIGLTAEQRLRIQEIRRSHDDEVIAAGRRIRQSRQALDRAIMTETYNESEVRRATEALAAAQADKIRLESSVRAQVRSVLTSEQVLRFHQLQREIRRDMKEQRNEQDKDLSPPGITNPPKREEVDPADLLIFFDDGQRN